MEERAKRVEVLAVGAHPDDIEIGCGGTLAALRARGKRIGVVDMTRGELGTRGDEATRRREAARAATILNLEFRANLDLPDGDIVCNSENRLALIRVIRRTRPDLIVTHTRFGHPDHFATSRLVAQAVHHSGLARIDTAQERHRPARIARWIDWFQPRMPEIVVDISDHLERKEEAIEVYTSQLHKAGSDEPETYLSNPEFILQLRSHAHHTGSLAGCRFAEGFVLSRLPRIEDLTRC